LDNWLQMQQEAAERVREMQKRARRYVEQNDLPPEPAVAAGDPAVGKAELLHKDADKTALQKGLSPPFGQDIEQLFLLMLAVLLVRSNAPLELILALLYLSL